ncbi:hypothetical protein [Metamycoplasma equirhinis]|uniref:hypothetical protein n=1 Tax=Metamycoplasma equirhinis TaxID=92402 RepID=UPI003593CE1D
MFYKSKQNRWNSPYTNVNLFNTYLVVGGIPKAVAKFVKSNNISNVNRILSDIDHGYNMI